MRVFDKCRLLGHMWDEYNPGRAWKGMFHNVIHLRCERCGTERHDSFDTLGDLTQRSYGYPEGYGYNKDDKPTRQQLRLAMHPRRNKSSKVP